MTQKGTWDSVRGNGPTGGLEGAGGLEGGEVTAARCGLHFGVTECSRAVVLALPNATTH